MAKCDLHVHSYFSGKTPHVKLLEPMDSYNTPEGIYELAKKRGMDFVTIADHDSIDGCLYFLNRFPDCKDFFISEEVTVEIPDVNYPLHVGVYNIDEGIHRDITHLRKYGFDLLDYLRGKEIFFVWNHPLFYLPPNESGYKTFEKLLEKFDLVEVYNGALPDSMNEITEKFFTNIGKKGVCGSDSHSMYNIGMCYVEADGDCVDDFLKNIRVGNFSIKKSSINFLYVYREAMSIYLGYARDLLWRHKAHLDWGLFRKIINMVGWSLWLPVFTVGSFIYVLLQFKMFYKNIPFYDKMFGELVKNREKDLILAK